MLFLFAMTLASSGCESASQRCGPTRAVVATVVDGDTVVLDSGERIRYLLVDTPELSGSECFAEQARDFNRDLVEGQSVTLQYDEECTDRFDRLLAYISVNGREINPLLVERGFACVLYIPPNGRDREGEFLDLESVAAAEGRGLWGACAEAPCS